MSSLKDKLKESNISSRIRVSNLYLVIRKGLIFHYLPISNYVKLNHHSIYCRKSLNDREKVEFILATFKGVLTILAILIIIIYYFS